jgi:hypothetical protein
MTLLCVKNTIVGKCIWQRLKEIKEMNLQFSFPYFTLHSITFLRHFFRTSNLLSYFLVALQTFFGYFFGYGEKNTIALFMAT